MPELVGQSHEPEGHVGLVHPRRVRDVQVGHDLAVGNRQLLADHRAQEALRGHLAVTVPEGQLGDDLQHQAFGQLHPNGRPGIVDQQGPERRGELQGGMVKSCGSEPGHDHAAAS
jgi:hypothetical protein